MLKKILSLLCVLAVCISFASCNIKSADSNVVQENTIVYTDEMELADTVAEKFSTFDIRFTAEKESKGSYHLLSEEHSNIDMNILVFQNDDNSYYLKDITFTFTTDDVKGICYDVFNKMIKSSFINLSEKEQEDVLSQYMDGEIDFKNKEVIINMIFQGDFVVLGVTII